jgi:hypothetical protein
MPDYPHQPVPSNGIVLLFTVQVLAGNSGESPVLIQDIVYQQAGTERSVAGDVFLYPHIPHQAADGRWSRRYEIILQVGGAGNAAIRQAVIYAHPRGEDNGGIQAAAVRSMARSGIL